MKVAKAESGRQESWTKTSENNQTGLFMTSSLPAFLILF
jgi:hypothetical protein